MSEEKDRRNKHLTLEERQTIQECLRQGMTFKAIGKRIGKDQTTVSKEIKRHITYDQRTNQQEPCPKLLKAPFVCNPCQYKRSCRKEKRHYTASNAQREYQELLVEARSGVALNDEQFWKDSRIISEGIKKGQHVYHIIQSNEVSCSQASAYRYIKRGYFSVATIDLPRAPKFKPRKMTPSNRLPKGIRENRTYACFLAYLQEHSLSAWVEMDLVIGRIGGKVLLTFCFTFCNLMLGFLLDSKTALSVSNAVLALKSCLAKSGFRFGDVFPIILTDNGGEFSDVFSLENDADGHVESRLFFCDPFQPSQKPHVEKGHTLLRDIMPKGSSFDDLSQPMVNLIFSHINSVKRNSLNGKTPFEVFSFTFSDELLSAFGISSIPASEVMQSSALLRK